MGAETRPPRPSRPRSRPPIRGRPRRRSCLGTAAVIRVGLTNTNAPGGDPFTFTVSAPAAGSQPAFNQSVTVAADGATSLDVPVDENGTRTITAAGPGFSQAFTMTGDCVADPKPIVSDSQVCTDGSGAIRVTLTNDNTSDGEPITFEVTSPAAGSQPAFSMVISLLGGEVRHIDVPVDENTSRTVMVSAPGMATVTLTRSIDCVSPAQPVASAYSFCDGAVGNLVMNVSNQNAPGGESVTFTIDVPGAGSQPALHRTVVVAGGGSEELTEIVDEGTSHRDDRCPRHDDAVLHDDGLLHVGPSDQGPPTTPPGHSTPLAGRFLVRELWERASSGGRMPGDACPSRRPEVRRLVASPTPTASGAWRGGSRASAPPARDLVVVVSAMGDTTDELLDLAAAITDEPGPARARRAARDRRAPERDARLDGPPCARRRRPSA